MTDMWLTHGVVHLFFDFFCIIEKLVQTGVNVYKRQQDIS